MSGFGRRLASIAAGALLVLVAAAPAWADALYPSDAAGTWTFEPDRCDGMPWSRTYYLGYVLNDSALYDFDVPNPDVMPGETITVELAPTVVGTLHGSVTIEGTTTITGQLAGEGAFGGLVDPNGTFTLGFVPGPTTVGALPVDGDDWDVLPVGIAAVTAMITGTESGVQRIVALAQPFVPCDHPIPATGGIVPNAASASPADATPGPTGEVLALPDSDGAPRATPGGSPIAVAGVLLAVILVVLTAMVTPRGRRTKGV
jgi:hypothetical protein